MTLKLLQKQLKEAERELDAATRLPDVKEAAAYYMRIKAELKRLEQQTASA
jgi:predicted nucleic acid-binding protein